jgi:guanylate kinase
MKHGPLIILSGPSGSGKSTLTERVLAEGGLPLHVAVSATTRPPRPGERDGVHYHFWTPERFQQEVEAGHFLEWADVHTHRYGTLRGEVDGYRARGMGVILVIDVQGAASVRKQCPDNVSVFVRTSTWELLEHRLRGRRTESAAEIAKRLDNARQELAREGEYDYVLINDDLEVAVRQFRDLIATQFARGPSCSTN